MNYIVKPRAARKIYTFYGNVAKKYRHSYDAADYKRNVQDTITAIYDIEKTLVRCEPLLRRWAGYHMANKGKWYYAYIIDGDTITVVDACHARNMHE